MCHHQTVWFGSNQLVVILCSWEGKHMSGIALAVHYRLNNLKAPNIGKKRYATIHKEYGFF